MRYQQLPSYCLQIGQHIFPDRFSQTSYEVTGILVTASGYRVSLANHPDVEYSVKDEVKLAANKTYADIPRHGLFVFADNSVKPRVMQKLTETDYRAWGYSTVHNLPVDAKQVKVWRVL